jgi:AAA15 family ATPase/GTPase
MPSLYPFSLKIRNFKCFGNEEQGFDEIKCLNLILGRNNSGKSTILDFLEHINRFREIKSLTHKDKNGLSNRDIEIPQTIWHKNSKSEIIARVELTEKTLRNHFSSIGNIDKSNISALLPEKSQKDNRPYHQLYESTISGSEVSKEFFNCNAILKVSFHIRADDLLKRLELESEIIRIETRDHEIHPMNKLLELAQGKSERDRSSNTYKGLFDVFHTCARKDFQSVFDDFFGSKIFKRIYPDRNILPEEDDINHLGVNGDGKGVTNIIQNFYNKEELDRSLVEKEILSDLNLIFKGDAFFGRILPRRKNNGKWEIALEEASKGLIPLSQSGSSLKTVMIILVYLYLVPSLEKKDLSQYAFLIEELENNLHPSLLRRLLSYIAGRAKEDGCIFFMATHASIAIDMFSHDEDAQIIHVTHNGESSYAETVTTPLNGLAILDDLGVKASDLLQANGIIWVEGPSDVIYIDKWLEMYCRENQEKKFRRGIDYEFQMFGGTLLDSLCFIKYGLASEEEERKKLVEMFSFSRNAFVVIDSDAVKIAIGGRDKTVDKSKFKSAKKFIKSQFEELNAKGLNLGLWYKAGNTQIRTLEDYLDADTVAALKSRKLTKKIYAQTATDSWSDSKRLDEFPHGLKKEIKTLYELIKKWNR